MGQCVPKCLKATIPSDSVSAVIEDRAKRTMTSSEIGATCSARPLRIRSVQNFTLLWLDSNFDEHDRDFKNSLTQLRRIVNTIDTFTDPNQCVTFLKEIKNEKAFMLVSGALSQSIIPIVHDLSQLDSIYIFCQNKSTYEQCASEWTKVKGDFTQIETICDVLKQDTQQCDHDSILISVTSKDLDRLEPSFMYTQLLKEILFDMEYDENAKAELVKFCRAQFHNNPNELEIINEFERAYHAHTPIWWYTCECFTYQMLNRALRIQDVEIIIKMGFFLRDIHRHLQELHSKIERCNVLTVYRGKTMANIEFDEIKKKQDGLLAFNTFLSTSLNENISLEFAKKSLQKPDTVGVIFQITIDTAISTIPFASISTVSAIPNEEEILFSMHTVFRIGQIQQIQDRIWRVELALTRDDDQELKRLTECIRQETSDSTKWQRLGHLLIKMGKFDKAEEVFQMLLEETFKNDESIHSSLYFHLGDIKCSKGDYKEALEFYQKSLDSNPSDLISIYNSIGLMHDKMGAYADALEFYLKSFEIGEKSLDSNQIKLAATCNSIGAAYCHTGEYTKALEFYQKSAQICVKSSPSDHSDLANTDSNIAQIDQRMQEYSKAIEAYQKILEIRQKTLPPNHPDLAAIYNSIGLLHSYIGEFSKALEDFHKELEIKQKSLPQNHPDFAMTYSNIGSVHSNMGEHTKALEFYQKALEISLKSLTPNHPDLATTYNNIGLLYSTLGDYAKALEFIRKSVEIKEATLPSNHQDVFAAYNNIGLIYWNIGDYPKALPFYERAVEIAKHSLPQNHPAVAAIFNTIGLVHIQMGNYSKALEFFEKSLELKQANLPADHPDLAKTYNHIGLVHWNMGDYAKALPCYERAVDIGQRALPQNHPYLQMYREVLAQVQGKCNSP